MQVQTLTTNIYNGLPGYTYNTLVYNAIGALVANYLTTSTSTSSAFGYIQNPAWGIGKFTVNTIVTDSNTPIAPVTNTLTYTANTIPTLFTTDEAATLVIGQPNLHQQWPRHHLQHSIPSRYILPSTPPATSGYPTAQNNRILEYNAPFTTNEAAINRHRAARIQQQWSWRHLQHFTISHRHRLRLLRQPLGGRLLQQPHPRIYTPFPQMKPQLSSSGRETT